MKDFTIITLQDGRLHKVWRRTSFAEAVQVAGQAVMDETDADDAMVVADELSVNQEYASEDGDFRAYITTAEGGLT